MIAPSLLIALALCPGDGPVRQRPVPTPPPTASGPGQVQQAMADLRLDGARVSEVSGLSLQRDVARLEFDRGQLVLLEPLDGHRVGAVFIGAGRLGFRPPTAAARAELARFYEMDSLSIGFRSAVLLFTDSTDRELQRLDFRAPATVPKEAREARGEAFEYLTDRESGELDPDVLRALVNRPNDGLFHVHVEPEEGDPLFFRLDGSAWEKVAFGRKARAGGQYEVINRFHALTDYRTGTAAEEAPPSPVSVAHYTIEVEIDGDLDFSARATLRLDADVPAGTWVPFWLFSELSVDSVAWGSDRAAEHYRLEDGHYLWVRLPSGPDAGARLRLTVWYAGDLLDRQSRWVVLRSPTGWYPQVGGLSTFDLTFRTPSKYEFASVGERVSSDTSGDRITSRWASRFPAPHASFSIGEFQEYDLDFDGLAPVVLQVNARARWPSIRVDGETARLIGDELERNVQGQVIPDIANSVSFFQSWFGPAPIAQLHVTETPHFHGQAFPGLVHLPWTTLQWTSGRGYDEIFRAHEIAHQWWGLGVAPRTYHDEWLSEGLAEFSGLWYMHSVLGQPEKYLDRLREAREDILDRRGKVGPIWLGPRLIRGGTDEDYQVIVYQKGAWILHMLRNLFLDLRTLDDGRFLSMLKDLHRSYRGKELSTEAFQSHVEEHAGIDLDWFFEQWVYGSAIPTYRVSYRGEPAEGGGYRVTARLRQENVPEDFRMYVPVFVSFGEGAMRFRLHVQGSGDVELPLMPEEPEKIVFNALESVLAEVKDDGWESR